MRCAAWSTSLAGLLILLGCGSGAGGDPDAGPGAGDAANAPDAGGGGGPDAGEPSCTFVPTGEFNPELECSWDGPGAGAAYPGLDDVVMTPVVANLTDDNADGVVDARDIPDIAFVSYGLQGGASCPAGVPKCGCCNSSGVLRVVSGACTGGVLTEHFAVGATEIEADTGVAGVWLDNSGGLALGDIDADGSIDIVGTTNDGGTIAFERDGTVKWYQPAYPARADTDHLAGTQPSLADVDGDGKPEVVQGRVVLNGEDGSLQWRGTAGLGTNGFMGPVSSLGDLDLDGKLDLLAGNTAYSPDGAPRFSYGYAEVITDANCQHQNFPCDGFTATGNFDADDEGEVVIVRAGKIYIVDHDGGLMQQDGIAAEIPIPIDDCAKNEGGPPTVADFDGDGEPEIGVAGADFYVVADLECLAAVLPAQCQSVGIRWTVANADCSSRVTGSSVFDFDGDGSAEVVYADEVAFRILRGADGAELLNIANRSHTRLEMPIVVDVDNDGNAEIVFVENASGGGTTQGLRVFGDATDTWVPTRRIWNQHSYHVTNVTELGGIPATEPANWLAPTDATLSGVMNNFRQNLPEDNAFAAPDLTVIVGFDDVACELFAKVCNVGDIVVGAGVPVHFYDNTTGEEIACEGGPLATTAPLGPGECETLSCPWPDAPSKNIDVRACADNEGYDCTAGPTGGNNECDEDNNAADLTAVDGCATVP